MKPKQRLYQYFGCVFLVAWLLQSSASHACECQFSRLRNWSPDLIRNWLDQSVHVFVGQVLAHDDHTVRVVVLDVFKGPNLPDTLSGEYGHADGCEKLISPGLWIFYVPRLNEQGRIPVIDACNMSSSLTEPNLAVTLPAPSRTLDSTEVRLFVERQLSQQQTIFAQNWLQEYALLCAYRRRHNAPGSPATFTIPVAVGVALAISTVFLLLFRWRRKHPSAG